MSVFVLLQFTVTVPVTVASAPTPYGAAATPDASFTCTDTMGTSLSTRTCGCFTTCASVPAATAVLSVNVVVPLEAGAVRLEIVTDPLSEVVTAAPVTKIVSFTIEAAALANPAPDNATSPSVCDQDQDEGTTIDRLASV